MNTLNWFVSLILLLIVFSCNQKRDRRNKERSFNKITLIEYKTHLNKKDQKYDLNVQSYYQINPEYNITAYRFQKGNKALFKVKPRLKKQIDNLIQNYQTDTVISIGETMPLYHGYEYLLVKEFNSGKNTIIHFSPVRTNKDLDSLIAVLQTDDYKILLNKKNDNINKKILDEKYERLVEQKIGFPEYPVLSEINWPKPENR